MLVQDCGIYSTSVRLQYLQCVSNEDSAVSHYCMPRKCKNIFRMWNQWLDANEMSTEPHCVPFSIKRSRCDKCKRISSKIWRGGERWWYWATFNCCAGWQWLHYILTFDLLIITQNRTSNSVHNMEPYGQGNTPAMCYEFFLSWSMITEIDAKCQGLAISNSGLQKRKAAKVLADLSEAVFETSPVKLWQFLHFCQGSRALTMHIFKRSNQIL